ncbi:uncharacterized protein METZ01_LOCUS188956 [marine metagenome]|uniref:Uncharacterized protein n=1 Tax=marine metagenome TaxID=408172 RepID=A0A382DDK3_9ZZZZ
MICIPDPPQSDNDHNSISGITQSTGLATESSIAKIQSFKRIPIGVKSLMISLLWCHNVAPARSVRLQLQYTE